MENKNCIFSPVRRKRLEVQGATGYTDSELKDYAFGFRFAYFVCGALVLTGLILQNTTILMVATGVAFLGMLPPYHPLDYLYNYLIRHLINKPKLPPRPNQARFACGIATFWLAGVIYLFYIGSGFWAIVLGGGLMLSATLVSVFDICIPSMIYNAIFKIKNPSS